MPPVDHTLLWGLTWANVIAFAGIIINLIWNWRNSSREKKSRTNTRKLDHFIANVRVPLAELLMALGDHMDIADEISAGAFDIATKRVKIAELRTAFHKTRRKLARRLTDCDESSLVLGSEWSGIEGMDMDNASDALDRAARQTHVDDLPPHLLAFVTAVYAVRARLTAHLDQRSDELMK